MKNKQHYKLFFVSLAMIIVAGSVGLAIAHFSPTLTPHKTVSTQPITNDNVTGGQIQTEAQKPFEQEEAKQSGSTDNSRTSSRNQSISSNASPKQESIRNSITTEHTYRALMTSNDPLTASSWAFNNTKLPAAWDQSTGGSVLVAIIDTGFSLGHQDLTSQWHLNSGELDVTKRSNAMCTGDPQTNNCDDDSNGYTDDWRGWDFIGNGALPDNNPQAGATNASGSAAAHGTAVAGLAGAASNNGLGIASYNWQTKLMPLQVLNDSGIGYTSDVVAAVYYAVDNGANIINMSLGGSDPDEPLSEAIQYAYNHNVTVIAAAGNCGNSTNAQYGCGPELGTMGYPALDRHVVAVGATTQSNTRAGFSSWGRSLDVVAPGSGSIASTMWTSANPNDSYATNLDGTSFASPIVASLASLILSQRPDATVDELTSYIAATAQKIPTMNGQLYTPELGHGLIDSSTAVQVARSLSGNAPTVPILAQTGSYISEHTFTNSSQLSSGCTTAIGGYCTIWAEDINTGYYRYLPYSLTNSSGQVGWSWSGQMLGPGDWSIRAQAGKAKSNRSYELFQK